MDLRFSDHLTNMSLYACNHVDGEAQEVEAANFDDRRQPKAGHLP